MRNKRRLSVVFALAATVALAAAGSALGTTSSENFTVTPKTGLGSAGKPVKALIHTHTDYATGSFVGTHTNRSQLYFDKNITFNQSVVPKCTAASLSGNITMQAAMTACGPSLVGTGTAQANAGAPGDSNACVLAFNRNPNGILLLTRVQVPGTFSCASAATNTGGNITVLLQAPLGTNPASTTPGGALTSSHYQGGKWLDFNNITTVATLPLRDFSVTTGKGAPQTNLTGTKANFIKAKCTTRTGLGSPTKKFVMRTVFTYNNGPSTANNTPAQVVNSKYSPCT